MLTLSGLRAGYGATPVLHGVDLRLAPTECAGGAGPQWGRQDDPDARHYRSHPQHRWIDPVRRHRPRSPSEHTNGPGWGFLHVPQGRDIFPKLTVLENLRVGTAARRDRRNDAVDRILEEFPMLAQRRRALGGSLSGGQQQLLALAPRALVTAPRLLLLDEPSEGIQPSVLDEIAEVIGRINAERGIAVLAVEQNLDFAARIARRALILEKGEIIAEAATAELRGDRALQRKYLAL